MRAGRNERIKGFERARVQDGVEGLVVKPEKHCLAILYS